MAHHSLRNHHKLIRLAQSLRIPPAHAAGLLEFLWWTAYAESDVGPAGSLPTSWTDGVIAHNAGWTGRTPSAFVKALVSVGLLDRNAEGNLSVHDLYDWAPDYVRRRWRRQGWFRTDQKVWLRDDRTLTSHDPSLTGHDQTCPAHDTRPDPTKRNEKKPGPVESLRSPGAKGDPRQTRAGPEVSPGEFTGPDRAARAQRDKFRSLFAAKVCIALGLNGQGAMQQRASLYAVARKIEGRADRDELAHQLIVIATEKRDAGLEKPIAAWQKEVNGMLGK